jgi:hypothetical protein
MATFALRIFLFTLFPLLLAGWIIWIDRSAKTKERQLDILLTYLFAVGVGGNGILSFFAHFFLSDVVADSIGWESGSPFQLEIAFANLAIGILGVIATGRRDGFREATVIAVTTFSLGATIVHFMDILSSGNLAPGNTIQNFANITRPILLIWFLRAARQAESAQHSQAQSLDFERWRNPMLVTTGPLTILISTAYGIGFTIDLVWPLTLLGVILGVALVTYTLQRSPLHPMIWQKQAV